MIDLDRDFEYPQDKAFGRWTWGLIAGTLMLAVFIATVIVKAWEAWRMGIL